MHQTFIIQHQTSYCLPRIFLKCNYGDSRQYLKTNFDLQSTGGILHRFTNKCFQIEIQNDQFLGCVRSETMVCIHVNTSWDVREVNTLVCTHVNISWAAQQPWWNRLGKQTTWSKLPQQLQLICKKKLQKYQCWKGRSLWMDAIYSAARGSESLNDLQDYCRV